LQLTSQGTGFFYHDHLILVKSNFLLLDVVQLPVNRNGSNDEKNRNCELKYNETTADQTAFHSQCQLTLQHIYRPESGKEERRIYTSNNSDNQRKAYNNQVKDRLR